MELEMADLDFFTLKYKHAERERKVGSSRSACGGPGPGCGPRACPAELGAAPAWLGPPLTARRGVS